MSSMQDVIRSAKDLAQAVALARKASPLKATEIAQRAGRARSLLYRLEQGDDVTVGALLDLLRAMDLTLRLEPLGLPSLEEVRRRFADEGDNEESTGP
jgi:HTH-type transcriptional regulator / antitoxin HipB